MDLITMRGRVSGIEKSGSVTEAGQSYLVEFDGQSKKVGSLNRAIEELGHRMRDYLKSAWGKAQLPWGLMVSADGQSAVYGDYPRFTGRGISPLASIRERYKEGEPPTAAISNAIQFVRAALKLK